MSDKLEQQDSVFGGGRSDGTDWKARCEQLERELASARVEQGRVKKLDEEKKALEKEISGLRSAKGREDMLSALSEEERGNVAPEVLDVNVKLLERQREDYERRFRELEARMTADSGRSAKEDFARRIDAAFPGFLSSVGSGGGNEQAWKTFKSAVGDYIDTAYQKLDFEGVAFFVRKFYSEIGSEVPTAGSAGSSAPDPNAVSGGVGGLTANGSKVYTYDEISALYDRIEQCRMREDFKEANRLEAEIDRAMAEGRVK